MDLALKGCLPEEYLAFQVSLEVRDFERTAVGTLSPVPLLGVLHARARHAGHGKFLFFGSEDTPVTDGSRELFDLAQDRAEITNLATEHPERVAAMAKVFEQWHQD